MSKWCWIVPMGLVIGCGGTTTNDGSSAYNRGPGSGPSASPTGINPSSPTQGEIQSVFAVLNGKELGDAKKCATVIDSLKRLPVAPKNVFILGASVQNGEDLRKPLKEAKISAIPIPLDKVEDWKKVLSSFGKEKLYGNGPSDALPNADQLTTDQSKLTSHFAIDGVRFVALNANAPIKGVDKPGAPRLWLTTRLGEFKETNVILLSWNPIRSLGDGDETPAISTPDLFGKSEKVRLAISSALKAPVLNAAEDSKTHVLAIGGGLGEDKMPHAGLIEVRKGGAMSAKVVKLEIQKPAKELVTATIWDPSQKATTKAPEKQVDSATSEKPKKG